jgi:hypothetical protein
VVFGLKKMAGWRLMGTERHPHKEKRKARAKPLPPSYFQI